MKRTIFIAAGSILLLLVFSVWTYLLLFGAPNDTSNIFTNFGFGNEDVTIRDEIPTVPIGQTGQLNIDSGSLVQLTTRPVAGFGFVIDLMSTSTEKVRYAERGVGHIYEIDLDTGVESRLLAKTYIGVVEAKFSLDGNAVVLIADEDNSLTANLEVIADSNANHQFPKNAKNISFINAEEVRYILENETGTIGYSYNLQNRTTNEIFNITLRDIKVLWGEGETLIYNKTAPRLRGGLYRITGNILTRIGETGYAFSALNNPQLDGMYIETAVDLESKLLQSTVFSGGTVKNRDLPIMALPEKCTFDRVALEFLWCASPLDNFNRSGHNDWFKGTLTSNDLLWKIDLSKSEATVIDDFTTSTNRVVDAIYPTMDKSGAYILFKNKLDDTLWLKKLKFGQ